MYEIELTSDHTFGGKGSRYYKVVNYDGNVEKLREFVIELNNKSNFWISWHIYSEIEGILEQEFEPLD